jgi:hypothetical protein
VRTVSIRTAGTEAEDMEEEEEDEEDADDPEEKEDDDVEEEEEEEEEEDEEDEEEEEEEDGMDGTGVSCNPDGSVLDPCTALMLWMLSAVETLATGTKSGAINAIRSDDD